MFGPTKCKYGSSSTSPARIESSVLDGHRSPLLQRHQASAQFTTETITAGGAISRIRPQRGCAARQADPLAGQVGDFHDRRITRGQDALLASR